MEQGTPIRLPNGTVGSFVSEVGPNKYLVDVPIETEKEGPDGNKTGRMVADIERIEVSALEVDFEEKNKQVDKHGNYWFTNQHGRVISPVYNFDGFIAD